MIAAFLVAERLLDLDKLWRRDRAATRCPRAVRIELFAIAASSVRSHLSDILRSAGGETQRQRLVQAARARRAQDRRRGDQADPLRGPQRGGGAARPADRRSARARTSSAAWSGCSSSTACSGSPRWPRASKIDELALTRAYTRLGEALGLDWAQQQVARFVPGDQWERLLTAGLARDFEQLRIDFLSRRADKRPDAAVERVDRRPGRAASPSSATSSPAPATEGNVSAPMLAQIASQARILLAR